MSDPLSADAPPSSNRSGTFFVMVSAAFLVTFLLFILFVSPRLQDRLGLNEGVVPFPSPPATVVVPLELDDMQVGVAVWDQEGVCAEITDQSGTTFRTCAVPDPLRAIWAIDAPDEAEPAYLLVATPPEATTVRGTSRDGETFEASTQTGEDLPAAWALMRLPAGAVVSEIHAFNAEQADLGGAMCGVEDAPTDGSRRLQGGCLVPRED
ncbi:MAG: hypothetical protein ACR2HR_02005 [Euzebya sp.]